MQKIKVIVVGDKDGHRSIVYDFISRFLCGLGYNVRTTRDLSPKSNGRNIEDITNDIEILIDEVFHDFSIDIYDDEADFQLRNIC